MGCGSLISHREWTFNGQIGKHGQNMIHILRRTSPYIPAFGQRKIILPNTLGHVSFQEGILYSVHVGLLLTGKCTFVV